MFKAQWLLLIVAFHVGVARSWDIAVGVGDQLIFYNEGYKVDTVRLKYQKLGALAYDGVHNTMLYVDRQNDNHTICGYEISSKKIECYIKKNGRNIHSLAYDPTTEILFFTDTNERSVNWISLKRGANNNAYGNLLFKMDDRTPTDIVVDSCRGNVYWINKNITKSHYMVPVEMARFDGSNRRKFEMNPYDSNEELHSFVMDPQIRGIFRFIACDYAEDCTIFLHLYYLGGKPTAYIYSNGMPFPKELTVTKKYLYWVSSSEGYKTIWQLSKSPRSYAGDGDPPKEMTKIYTVSELGIAANYGIDDEIRRIQDCDSLLSIMPTVSEASGKTVERCNVSACENYCVRGNCSVNDQGLPKCSCEGGYNGQRCEVPACHGYCLNNGDCSLDANSNPVCQCKDNHSGDRCEVSHCKNYCIQGNCRLSDEGLPTCSCNAGYTGDRCEVFMCHGYCLNDGDCTFNEKEEPVCQCVGNYEGSRCEVDINRTFTYTNTSSNYSPQKNLTLYDLLSNWQQPTAKISVTVEV